jgi:hypothetical protein
MSPWVGGGALGLGETAADQALPSQYRKRPCPPPGSGYQPGFALTRPILCGYRDGARGDKQTVHDAGRSLKNGCERRESRAAARGASLSERSEQCKRSEQRRSSLWERRRRRRIHCAMREQPQKKAASVGNRAPAHGEGASRGVLPPGSDRRRRRIHCAMREQPQKRP